MVSPLSRYSLEILPIFIGWPCQSSHKILKPSSTSPSWQWRLDSKPSTEKGQHLRAKSRANRAGTQEKRTLASQLPKWPTTAKKLHDVIYGYLLGWNSAIDERCRVLLAVLYRILADVPSDPIFNGIPKHSRPQRTLALRHAILRACSFLFAFHLADCSSELGSCKMMDVRHPWSLRASHSLERLS